METIGAALGSGSEEDGEEACGGVRSSWVEEFGFYPVDLVEAAKDGFGYLEHSSGYSKAYWLVMAVVDDFVYSVHRIEIDTGFLYLAFMVLTNSVSLARRLGSARDCSRTSSSSKKSCAIWLPVGMSICPMRRLLL